MDQHLRRTSGTFIVNRQASQVIMDRLCLPSIILHVRRHTSHDFEFNISAAMQPMFTKFCHFANYNPKCAGYDVTSYFQSAAEYRWTHRCGPSMIYAIFLVAEEYGVNHGGTTPVNGQTSHCRRCCPSHRQKSMGDHCSGGICRSTPTSLGRHGSCLRILCYVHRCSAAYWK